jgi:hypothetical protein
MLLLATYLLVFPFSYYLEYKDLGTKSYRGLSYDSRSPDAERSAVKELKEDREAELRQMTIAFRMKVHSMDSYNNVFQTAPGNSGIRLELSRPSVAALILTSRTLHGTDIRLAFLTRSMNLNTWCSVLITLDSKQTAPGTFLWTPT